MTIGIVIKLLESLALLIYGMKIMSEALQKMAGPGLRHLGFCRFRLSAESSSL